jgi:hypothetical protein
MMISGVSVLLVVVVAVLDSSHPEITMAEAAARLLSASAGVIGYTVLLCLALPWMRSLPLAIAWGGVSVLPAGVGILAATTPGAGPSPHEITLFQLAVVFTIGCVAVLGGWRRGRRGRIANEDDSGGTRT